MELPPAGEGHPAPARGTIAAERPRNAAVASLPARRARGRAPLPFCRPVFA